VREVPADLAGCLILGDRRLGPAGVALLKADQAST